MERIMANHKATLGRINLDENERANGGRAEFSQQNWRYLLQATGAVVFGCALVAILVPGVNFNRQQTLEATVRMERLARALESARTIAPSTAIEVSRLIRRPQYDCRQIACNPALAARNRAAQSKLKLLIDRNIPGEAFAAGDGTVHDSFQPY
jgi:hypothetical protein